MTHDKSSAPKIIGIYNTQGTTYRLLHDALKDVVTPCDNIAFCYVTGDDIQHGWLRDQNASGLVLPGRRVGGDYNRELGVMGYKAILDAMMNGLDILAVCAASYVLSANRRWYHEAENIKVARSPYPIFSGSSKGPIRELYENAYKLDDSATQHRSGLPHLPANIVTVSFAPHIGAPVNRFAVQYSGGGDFVGASSDTNVLAWHDNTVKPTPAIIEVTRGHGTAILSNIHPEISPDGFDSVFSKTLKAKQNVTVFQRDKEALAASQTAHRFIFRRFIDNCLNDTRHLPLNSRVSRVYGPLQTP